MRLTIEVTDGQQLDAIWFYATHGTDKGPRNQIMRKLQDAVDAHYPTKKAI